MDDQNRKQSEGSDRQGGDGHDMRRMYLRFGPMIATSVVVMYLTTYLNVFDVSHIHFSEERVYMALTMGGAMGVVMMAWMWGMYANRRWIADEIIEAQRREIAEMEWLLADIARNGEATTAEEADERPVPAFEASP
jgi:hypothetical protein